MPDTLTTAVAILGGGGVGATLTFVSKAWQARHAISAEVAETPEFKKAVVGHITDTFEKVTTQDLIDKRVDAGIEKFRDSTCLQKIVDDRFEHKMRSATMVFSSGLEVARSEIASMKSANDLYNQAHSKQHDELLAFMRRLEKKVDATAVSAAELRGRASLSDASDTDDDSVYPERTR